MKKTILLFLLISTSVFASKIDTLKIFSESMQKTIPNIIITPDFHKNQEKFPVLYLLHGAYGNYTNWLSKVPELQKYADRYQMMIVCPDGNPFSWYFDSPIDSTFRYESYISKELVSAIDKKYNTISSKKGRAITGLSMGGHGAFYLAFKHPEIFGAAGSMSGGMNLEKFSTNWKIAKQLGDYKEYSENWKNNTIINMVYLIRGKNTALIFDCGIDDFFYEVNKELHKKLLQNKILHDYSERPGKHDWNYWKNAIKYHLVFFNTFFKS